MHNTYSEGLMELKSPLGEPLFADVVIKNEDISFIQGGQSAQVKLAAYPFQKYGLLTGKVGHVSADATVMNGQGGARGGEREMTSCNTVFKHMKHYQISSCLRNILKGCGTKRHVNSVQMTWAE